VKPLYSVIDLRSVAKKKSDFELKNVKNVKKNVEFKNVKKESTLFSDLVFVLKRVKERKKTPYNVPIAKRGQRVLLMSLLKSLFFSFRNFF